MLHWCYLNIASYIQSRVKHGIKGKSTQQPFKTTEHLSNTTEAHTVTITIYGYLRVRICVHFCFSSVWFGTVWFGLVEHLNEVRYLALCILSKVFVNALYIRCVSLGGTFLPLKTWIESVARVERPQTHTVRFTGMIKRTEDEKKEKKNNWNETNERTKRWNLQTRASNQM